MKKVILALSLLLISAVSFAAPTASVEVGIGEQKGATVHSVEVKYDAFSLSLVRDSEARDEVGYTVDVPYTFNLLSVTGTVGDAVIDGSTHATYSVEPTISYTILPQLTVSGSYKYRNAFSSSVQDKDNVETVAIRYTFLKKFGVGIQAFNETGSDKTHGVIGLGSYSF